MCHVLGGVVQLLVVDAVVTGSRFPPSPWSTRAQCFVFGRDRKDSCVWCDLLVHSRVVVVIEVGIIMVMLVIVLVMEPAVDVVTTVFRHSPIPSFIFSFIAPLIHLFIDSFIHSSVHSSIHPYANQSIHALIDQWIMDGWIMDG